MELSRDLVHFIQEHIHSVVQLEALLLLRERGGDWTPERLAQELRITDESAEFRLRDLELRQLLSNGATAESYRYAPATAELRDTVDALAEAYREMKYSVINAIFSVPGDSARTLAEAFRFRKKKEGQ